MLVIFAGTPPRTRGSRKHSGHFLRTSYTSCSVASWASMLPWWRDRQTHRQTDRQTDTQRHKQNIQTDRQTDRQTERQTKNKTHRKKNRETSMETEGVEAGKKDVQRVTIHISITNRYVCYAQVYTHTVKTGRWTDGLYVRTYVCLYIPLWLKVMTEPLL